MTPTILLGKPKDTWVAVSTALLTWGFEIALVRVTAASLSWLEVAEAAIPWLLLAATALLVSHFVPATPGWRLVGSLLGWSLPMGLAAAILIPVAAGRGRVAVTAVALLLLAAWTAGAYRGRAVGRVFPSPLALLAVLLAASAATWILDPDPLPVPSLVVVAAGLWTAVALAARRPRWLAVLAVLGVVIARLPPEASYPPRWTDTRPVPEGPDIVLISIDTLRADVASGMRSYARLARHGVTFANVQTAAPWTLPSMATVMSGQPVPVHGAMAVEGAESLPRELRVSRISPDLPLLAERLHGHGYATAAVVAENLLLSRRFGFGRGFASYQHVTEPGAHPLPRGIKQDDQPLPAMSRLLNVVGYRLGFPALERLPVADAESVIGDALHLLSRRRSRPLFLWLHFMDCHLPYLHHPEISRLQFAARLRFATETEPYPAWYPPEQAAAAWRAYTAEAAYLDGQLERLLDVALAPPRHRRRAVVLVADHGEEFLDHGAIGHGGSFYQELVSIPLIVGGDPVRDRAGSVEEEVVDLLDVAPTVLALAGIPDPALPGQDLLGPLRPVEHVATALGPHVPWPHLNESFARREGRWKAILQPGRPLELYDLVADPGEQQNLAEVRPELATRLSRPSLLVAAAAGERPSVVLTEEEIRRLRALGYVQ